MAASERRAASLCANKLWLRAGSAYIHGNYTTNLTRATLLVN